MYKQYWIHTIEDIGRVESLLFLVENMDIECCSVSNFIICVQQTPTKRSILNEISQLLCKLHTIFLKINFFFMKIMTDKLEISQTNYCIIEYYYLFTPLFKINESLDAKKNNSSFSFILKWRMQLFPFSIWQQNWSLNVVLDSISSARKTKFNSIIIQII